MKIAVYAISKNEADFVRTFCESATHAVYSISSCTWLLQQATDHQTKLYLQQLGDGNWLVNGKASYLDQQ